MDGPVNKAWDIKRPRVLFLSHCLPLAEGALEQKRTATLLGMVAPYCDVSLACISQDRVRFEDWTTAHTQCSQFVIHRPGWLNRCAYGIARIWNPCGKLTHLFKQTIGSTLNAWLIDQQFDAVVATHPAFGAIIRRIRTRSQLVDFQSIRDELTDSPDQSRTNGTFTHRKRAQWLNLARYVAQRCSITIVDDRQTAHALAGTARSLEIIANDPKPLQVERVRLAMLQQLGVEEASVSASLLTPPLRHAA